MFDKDYHRNDKMIENKIDLNNDFFDVLKYGRYVINNIEPLNKNTDESNAKF